MLKSKLESKHHHPPFKKKKTETKVYIMDIVGNVQFS